MKKTKLLMLGTALAGVTTILAPTVLCSCSKENVDTAAIPESELIIKDGVLMGLKRPWEDYAKYTKIIIPSNVYKIEDYAFSSESDQGRGQMPESIKYLEFKENDTFEGSQLSIGNSAFSGASSLETIVFPKRLSFVGTNAFAECTNVKKIDFSSWDEKRAGEFNPFAGETIFRNWPTSGSVIAKNHKVRTALYYMLTTFEDGEEGALKKAWFSDIEPISILQPNMGGVDVYYDLINDCTQAVITNLKTHEGVTEIENWNIPAELPTYLEAPVTVPVTGIAQLIGTPRIDLKIKKLSVAEGSKLSMIGKHAFYQNTNLENVDLSNATELKLIDSIAFGICTKLISVTLPNSLETLAPRCFYGTGIKNIGLSTNMTRIMDEAFYDCLDLKAVNFKQNLTWIGNKAFAISPNLMDVQPLATITLPPNIKWIGDNAFECQRVAKGINLEGCGNLIHIGSCAFKNCNALQTISIPSSLEYLGPGALSNMPNLKTITNIDGGDPKYICYKNVVYNKDQTEVIATCAGSDWDLEIEKKLKKVGPYAFAGVSLKLLENELDLSSFTSLDTIGDYAFAEAGTPDDEVNEKTPIQIKLPNSVTTIGDYAFASSNVLDISSIINLPNLKTWGTYMFSDCDLITIFNSDHKIDAIPAGTFSGCEGLQSVIFDSGVKYVGHNAFEQVGNDNMTYDLFNLSEIPTNFTNKNEKPFNIEVRKTITIRVKESLLDEWKAWFEKAGLRKGEFGTINWVTE